MSTRHTLSVLVENKPGVLTRVAALFARRAFNIHSLAVGETEDPRISRMTVVVDAAELPIEQVTKQLNKLINVLKIVELDPAAAVERQLLLVKVSANDSSRANVLQIVDLFRAHVVDVVPDAVTRREGRSLPHSARALWNTRDSPVRRGGHHEGRAFALRTSRRRTELTRRIIDGDGAIPLTA